MAAVGSYSHTMYNHAFECIIRYARTFWHWYSNYLIDKNVTVLLEQLTALLEYFNLKFENHTVHDFSHFIEQFNHCLVFYYDFE